MGVMLSGREEQLVVRRIRNQNVHVVSDAVGFGKWLVDNTKAFGTTLTTMSLHLIMHLILT
jgi:hypothetical protein